MLNENQFAQKLVNDLKAEYEMVAIENEDTLTVGSSDSHACLPLHALYREYVLSNGQYALILKSNRDVINEVIKQFVYEINYAAVYPIIKKKSFGCGDDMAFYRKPLWCDLDILWVEDFGTTFRFIQQSDNFDKELLISESQRNLSKLCNKLKRLDDSLDIYSFFYTSDYSSSLILDPKIQESMRKISDNLLICIPSNSSVIISKFTMNPDVLDILEKLMTVDQDPNRVSSNIYSVVDGEYTIVNRKRESQKIRLIK